MAVIFERNSDYINVTYYYRRARFVADSARVKAPYFVINLSLAKLYGEIDNREMAEFYFQQAEKELDVPQESKALYYNFRGVFHVNMKDWPKALEYHRLYNQFVQSGQFPSQSYPFQRALSTVTLGKRF